MSQLSANEAAGGTTSLYFALMMPFSGNTKTSGTILGVQVMLDGIDGDLTSAAMQDISCTRP